jgi:hypothetical protein
MENKQEQPQQVKVRKNWPLHRAVQEGDLSKVSDLLADTTTDVNARNVDKETALQLACALYADAPKIFGPIIKALVKAKADPNKRDVVQGFTCVHAALRDESGACLELLIDECKAQNTPIDLNKANFLLETPLHYCGCHGNLECAKVLLKHGANVNVKTSRNTTPLAMAKEGQHTETAQFLSTHGGEVFPEGPAQKLTFDLPQMCSEGFVNSKTTATYEKDYGGAMYHPSNYEVFYFGKKPRVGLGFCCNFNLKTPKHGKNWIKFFGIISEVVAAQKFVATLKLWPDWDMFSDDFPGDWVGVFEFDYDKSEPWICTSLKALKDSNGATMESMEKIAAERVEKGRRYEKKERSGDHWVLKGNAADADTKVITKVEFKPTGILTYTFADGSEHNEEDPRKNQFLFQQMLMQLVDMVIEEHMPVDSVATMVVNNRTLTQADYNNLYIQLQQLAQGGGGHGGHSHSHSHGDGGSCGGHGGHSHGH